MTMCKQKKDILYTEVLIFGTVIATAMACLTGCIQHSTNPTADKAIHTIGSAYPDDNFVEEGAEEVIEDYTSLDIDISPRSPECLPECKPVEIRRIEAAEKGNNP